MAYTREILTLSVEIGDAMLRSGAEIYRVEDTVTHILQAYEIEEFDVYVLSNGIFASANEGQEDACSVIRHVPLAPVHLGKVSALNQLARDICSHDCSLVDAWVRLDECNNIPEYPRLLQDFCCALGSATFCYMFGGQVLDAVIAFIIGFFEKELLFFFTKNKWANVLRNLFASAFVTLSSILFYVAGLPIHQDKIVIGAIMILVPGIALTTSIRDVYNGDYLSGTIHLIDALLTAACIAVGVCISLFICQELAQGGFVL